MIGRRRHTGSARRYAHRASRGRRREQPPRNPKTYWTSEARRSLLRPAVWSSLGIQDTSASWLRSVATVTSSLPCREHERLPRLRRREHIVRVILREYRRL